MLITFPLKGASQTQALVDAYVQSHASFSGLKTSFNFVQLGSTGIWTIPEQEPWVTRHSRYDVADARAQAEDELLRRGGAVVNLAGLWGGQRNAVHWIDRVAGTKEILKGKGSLHMVHGVDVARAIVAVHRNFGKAEGQRWVSGFLSVSFDGEVELITVPDVD